MSTQGMVLFTRAVVLVLLIGWSVSRGTAQTIYYVDNSCGSNFWSGRSPDCNDPDGNGPKFDIQPAIDAAQSGDTIVVAPGRYDEVLDFLGKDITVVSRDGPGVTTIDAAGRRAVVTFRNGEGRAAVLAGFTIRNGVGNSNGGARIGGGIMCYRSSPTIMDNVIRNNTAHFGGGMDCEESSPLLIRNLITDNAAIDSHLLHVTGDGGGVSVYNSAITLVNNVIVANRANRYGGALAVNGELGTFDMQVTCINNLIIDNFAEDQGGGGALWLNVRGNVSFSGCTLAGNATTGAVDGLWIDGDDASVTARNSIVYSNGDGTRPQALLVSGTLNVQYCDFQDGRQGVQQNGGVLNWGPGNIALDPLFVDPELSDYHLQVCSPAVNAGDPNYIPGQDERDIDGQARRLGSAIDMGADEVPHADANGDGVPDECQCDPCDANCDGAVNASDIQPFIGILFDGDAPCGGGCAGDTNRDGSVNSSDIEGFITCLFG